MDSYHRPERPDLAGATSQIDAGLTHLLRRDRWVVGLGLAAVALLAWIDLIRMAGAMPAHGAMAIQAWSSADFVLMTWMWVVMMVAMMLPSAAPMILLYAAVRRRYEASVMAPTVLFAAGYLTVWSLFSVAATALQWQLDSAALLSPRMVAASPALGGLILIGAGVYQCTSWKDACLRHCRAPVPFIMRHWRRGRLGVLRMGIEHGAYCVGCCWALMALLFVGGVMNFLCIGAIAFFVLLEKVAPRRGHGGRLSGAGLTLAGVLLLADIAS